MDSAPDSKQKFGREEEPVIVEVGDAHLDERGCVRRSEATENQPQQGAINRRVCRYDALRLVFNTAALAKRAASLIHF